MTRDGVELTRNRVREGVTKELDVANAFAQAETTESLIPTLESRSEPTINGIGVLEVPPNSSHSARYSAAGGSQRMPDRMFLIDKMALNNH
ncbi:hypothetical protein [Caballeronia glathei]|uniref:Uncharacterized protein n=1 Tax=Caballeronia glathei TaxID=60547 RepID=A0A069PLZ5_9BURK|nr:hypothetical protein BG61_41545 [Caballeronia glathei]